MKNPVVEILKWKVSNVHSSTEIVYKTFGRCFNTLRPIINNNNKLEWNNWVTYNDYGYKEKKWKWIPFKY